MYERKITLDYEKMAKYCMKEEAIGK